MNKIHIVDYGFNNLNSLFNAFRKVKSEISIGHNISDINNSNILILPGVGTFKSGMLNLKEKKISQLIKKNFYEKKFIAICLSMQMIFNSSDESFETNGLDLIQGSVVEIKNIEPSKSINIGWEKIKYIGKNSLFESGNYFTDKYFYFAHKYCLDPQSCHKDLITANLYGTNIPAIIEKNNFIGLQFHPEKSGRQGLDLIKFILEKFEKN